MRIRSKQVHDRWVGVVADDGASDIVQVQVEPKTREVIVRLFVTNLPDDGYKFRVERRPYGTDYPVVIV